MKSLVESNEMITIYISGISDKVILKSFYVICTIVLIILLTLSNLIYPETNLKIANIKYNVDNNNIFYSIKPKTIVSIQEESIYVDEVKKEDGFIDMIIIRRDLENGNKYVSMSKLVKFYEHNSSLYVDSFDNKSFLFDIENNGNAKVVESKRTTSSLDNFLQNKLEKKYKEKASTLSTISLIKNLILCKNSEVDCKYNVKKIIKEIDMRVCYPFYIYMIGLSGFLPFLRPMNSRLLRAQYHFTSFGMFFISLALSLVISPQISISKYFYLSYIIAILAIPISYINFRGINLNILKPSVFIKIFNR